jgi:adenosylcobinamide kinase/adenosylcobinamide-phosphate guanylyltransferase
MLTVVTGGARSGKSGFAERLVMHEHGAAIYIATGQAYDEEMQQRIELHRRSREAAGFPWRTMEEPHELSALLGRLAAAECGGLIGSSGTEGEKGSGDGGTWVGDGSVSDKGLNGDCDVSDEELGGGSSASDEGLGGGAAGGGNCGPNGGGNRERPGVLVDCLTLWLSNRLLQLEHEPERDELLAAEIQTLVEAAAAFPGRLTLVTNEVGSGIVPEYKLGRDYRDWAGRLNRLMAERAERVFLVTAGIPVEIKSLQYRFAAPVNGGG